MHFLSLIFFSPEKTTVKKRDTKQQSTERKCKTTGDSKRTTTRLHGHGGIFYFISSLFFDIKRLITIISVGIIIYANILWQSSMYNTSSLCALTPNYHDNYYVLKKYKHLSLFTIKCKSKKKKKVIIK